MFLFRSIHITRAAVPALLAATLIAVASVLPTKSMAQSSATPATTGAPPPSRLFARVNGHEISQDEFHATYADYLRRKYYHGQVPENELKLSYETVSRNMIDTILLLQEVKRREMQPDDAYIKGRIGELDARFAKDPQWPGRREAAINEVLPRLTNDHLLDRLQDQVHAVPDPSDAEVKAYYDKNPEQFTEPEKIRMHVILLKVDPTSLSSVWDTALEEAAALVKKLRNGASFEDAARIRSGDDSAEMGGDMGYLHQGMTPPEVEELVKTMKPGDITDPVRMLPGVAIFRFDDRQPAVLRAYGDVAPRAKELLLRVLKTSAWDSFMAKLRSDAKIEMLARPFGGESGAR
jgi:hypothetical protein